MQTRQFADRPIPAIGLGAMPLTTERYPDDREAAATIHAALDAGIRLIDTADAYAPDGYGLGANEEVVAAALASYSGSTDDVIVATKGGHTRPDGEWGLDGSPAYLRKACEASLRRLGVDAIDLYQHHRPDPSVAYEDTMGGLRDLYDDGLIKHAGISNADPDQIRLAHEILGPALVAVQNQFSPKFRSSEPEIGVCEQLGLAFLPWSPLGGMSDAKGLGASHAVFADVADKHGVSPQQVCLAWEMSLSDVVIPIPGASRPESIRDSAAAADLRLTAEELAALSG